MSEYGITFLDLGVVILVGLSALLAMSRGVIREGLGLLGWVGAFIVAWLSFAQVRPFVEQQLMHPLLTDVVTAVVVFVVPLILFKVLASIVAGGVDASFLRPIDKGLGLLFGAARGAFIVAAGYLIASTVIPPKHHPAWVQEAALLPSIQDGAVFLASYLPEDIIERSRESVAETGERARALRNAAEGYDAEATQAVDRLVEGAQ